MRAFRTAFVLLFLVWTGQVNLAGYVNFESSHVHPIALTPNGTKLLAVNTPDALLEVLTIDATGRPVPAGAIPVGLEPVTVVARTDSEVWVANRLSDTISIVDLGLGMTVKTIRVGDEPTDVAFARGKAFVAVSHEDVVKVYDLANLDAQPIVVSLFSSGIRALAVSTDGNTVYAVAQDSGNQTTVVNANVIAEGNAHLNASRLAALGLNDMTCSGPRPPYPPLPPGIARNPALVDPPDRIPKVGLIVKWDTASGGWKDDAGQDWTGCLPYRTPDHDLFAIDAASPASPPVAIDHVGTTLFEVSVNPASGKVYVPNTEALNTVRFEPRIKGHVVDDRLTIVNPAAGNAVTLVDLNTHIDRGSDPATNLGERMASVSQPGMMVWKSDGSAGYLTAIGSRKVFVVDGSCTSGGCIFGPSRATPRAVEVGEGPTGVALLEAKNRLYVLNRFSNSIAVVDATSLSKLAEIPLHDPSSGTIRAGRRFLYDAILSSAHGDAACSSCHISGDKDGIAWDLGDPPGSLVPYSRTNDNVRFVQPSGGQPATCNPSFCAAHSGFDPQKGPMTTQTLRAMLEPLHWRGDRATMNEFNPTFVTLQGARDVGPINGKPAGLNVGDMETYRQFALGIRFPPNPNRLVDDTLPTSAPIPGTGLTGNPSTGEALFNLAPTDSGGTQPCVACHAAPFGTAGGKLGGVVPQEPTSPDATGLLNGTSDNSPHSDLKISHLRNMMDKPGFLFGPAAGPYPDVKAGVGFTHDGSIPNLPTFLSLITFSMFPEDARNLSSFLLHFPTGTKPAVGWNLTFPPGAPPTGSASDESLLSTLVSLGDIANANRHCELTATALGGGRMRSYRLSGGAWLTDVAGEPSLATAALRQAAAGPISFLCATIASGPRLGGDRDEDSVLNGDDCAPGDPLAWAVPPEVSGLSMSGTSSTQLAWADQSGVAGPGVRYDVVGGSLSALISGSLAGAACIAGDLPAAAYVDPRANPLAGEGYYYLVRGETSCGPGGFGAGRAALDVLSCAPP